jgi:hypothetical protein
MDYDKTIEAMAKAGRAKMDLMHFGDDGYESNEQLWTGIMQAALSALQDVVPEENHKWDAADILDELKTMGRE